MDPMFMAISYFRRRRFDDCIEVCSRMLQKNPYDQVRQLFARTRKSSSKDKDKFPEIISWNNTSGITKKKYTQLIETSRNSLSWTFSM